MKNFKNLALKILVSLIILASCFLSVSYATEDVALLSEGEPVTTNYENVEVEIGTEPITSVNEGDLYLFEDSVNITSPVSGNVFVMAQEVTINSVIDGNVFIFADKVNIATKAYVYSDVFICANEITIDGYAYDVYAVSESFDLTSSARIIRDLKVATNSLKLSGTVKRNADLTFNTVDVDEALASIGGNLTYSSSSETIPESIVSGEISFSQEEVVENTTTAKDYIEDVLTVLVVALIVILIVIYAMPKFAQKEVNIVENKALISFGYGALALILIPLACFILFCTVIGIIPALAILFAYIFVLFISSAIVSLPLGRMICKKLGKDTKGMNILISMALVLVIWALEQIPVIGSIVALLVAIFGLGILVYAIFHSKIDANKKDIVAEASTVIEANKDEKKDSDKE
ncbi:MAG: hypothetical protein ACI4VQ_06800 [Clostridia bacterium]